ncbi:MAG: FtsW/RodA/SpoVE family cell cycle protein [Lachnospiraceae bacterium]|nr:FtsW/RodA/SpoVE family cell cycle protein [Lachnospiraceae bacterium]
MAETAVETAERLPEQRAEYKKVNVRSMVLAVILLVLFGLVMIFSAGNSGMDASFKNQLLFAVFGIFIMFVIARFFSYKWIAGKGVIFLYAAALIFMVVVNFTSLGVNLNGSTRWIRLFGFSFQPTELVKTTVIILTARQLFKKKNKIGRQERVLVPEKGSDRKLFRNGLTVHKNMLILLALVAPLFLLVTKNNLSSGIIILLIVLAMLYVGTGAKKIYIAFMVLAVVGFVVIYFYGTEIIQFLIKIGLIKEYQARRIIVWMNPEAYSSDGGWQVLRGLYAIGSGGFWGKGLGKSVVKASISQAHSDMIFSIICEELGLFGAFCLMGLYVFLIYRLYVIAKNARDSLGSMLVFGVMIHIGLQVVMHIAVVSGMMPNTGVSLPFVSHGGSSLLFLFIEMGIVLNVAKTARIRVRR